MFKWLFSALLLLSSSLALAQPTWEQIKAQANGQRVFMHISATNPAVKQYLEWAAPQLKRRYGVTLNIQTHADMADVIQKLQTGQANAAGQAQADIVWVNGAHFLQLQQHNLLAGPFTALLPNWTLINHALPASEDFSVPTQGLEVPWGASQLVFAYNPARLYNPPRSVYELLSYARSFPGRFSYPTATQFQGLSFLNTVLLELSHQDAALRRPVTEQDFQRLTAPLWRYLDELHPYCWQQGRTFADNRTLLSLLSNRQLDLIVTSHQLQINAAQQKQQLSSQIRTYSLANGALTVMHFLAIPRAAHSTEGALVTINFLLSPQAQSYKANPQVWGDLPVIAPPLITGYKGQMQIYSGYSAIHFSWQQKLSQAWQQRYATPSSHN